jgi:hypothetical protein
MCGNDKLKTLKESIEQRRRNNLVYSQSETTASLPKVEMKTVYSSMANEDRDILMMIDMIERCD